jgi:hypothetical protein
MPHRIRIIALVARCTLMMIAVPATATASQAFVASWASVLDRHTRSVEQTVGTQVDYRGLREGDGARPWKSLIAELASAKVPDDRAGTMAFWIDAYNILAIQTVLRAWPVESIRDAGNLLWPVWRREAGVAAGRSVTLHEIEHEILRPMGDPRIHAAIVCASTSCPSLRRTPFSGGDLDTALDEAMRSWLASRTKGMRIDRERKRITVSKIFDWFEEDFDAVGGVRAVLRQYGPEPDRSWLAGPGAEAEIAYFDYDWRLNDWPPGDPAPGD